MEVAQEMRMEVFLFSFFFVKGVDLCCVDLLGHVTSRFLEKGGGLYFHELGNVHVQVE